ncbi:hypothetical protein TNCV_241541 [Trichonephila clavipes]|uniref:Uncharacterized protein n=1 Tax=Trichonephila clavipes TaxID=2585209 RepID=A0A8X6W4M5_TRICX|nr:hypothetical protein TNCV_241541 [Trichonephila clavipes]
MQKLNPKVETEYSDVNERRVISKFAVKSKEKAVYGTEKFKRDTPIVAFDKLILDLNRRSQVYADYNDVDQHLVKEGIRYKTYLKETDLESYTCRDIFNLIFEKKLVGVFPNFYTILKIFLTLPVESEAPL